MNLNCYDYYPKEERKHIQSFIDDVDFMAAELLNMYEMKEYKLKERHPDDIADEELRHLEHLEAIIDTAEDIAHELRRYKEDIC